MLLSNGLWNEFVGNGFFCFKSWFFKDWIWYDKNDVWEVGLFSMYLICILFLLVYFKDTFSDFVIYYLYKNDEYLCLYFFYYYG